MPRLSGQLIKPNDTMFQNLLQCFRNSIHKTIFITFQRSGEKMKRIEDIKRITLYGCMNQIKYLYMGKTIMSYDMKEFIEDFIIYYLDETDYNPDLRQAEQRLREVYEPDADGKTRISDAESEINSSLKSNGKIKMDTMYGFIYRIFSDSQIYRADSNKTHNIQIYPMKLYNAVRTSSKNAEEIDESAIIINEITDRIKNFFSEQEFNDERYNIIVEDENSFNEIISTVHSNRINNINEVIENTPTKLIDYNEEFKAKYTGTTRAELFLDTDLEEPVYLSDVYVQPRLSEGSEEFKNYLVEWSNGSTPVLLLCGKAGVGKTSLVSELISNDVFKGKAHAVFLRYNTEAFESSDPWASVKKAFKCDDDTEYQNKILILDGFDELCVLKKEFKGHEFLTDLSEGIPVNKNIRILITSREYKGYFDKVESKPRRLSVCHIEWSESEMLEWCDRYSSKRNNDTVTKWCEDFKNIYNDLDEKRREILCTPIILYICCHENINVSQDSTVVEIYDKAFKSIVTREYSDNKLQQETGLSAVEGAVVMWQLIKELAYQMYLNDKLDSGAGTDLIDNAKSRVLKLKNNVSSLNDENITAMMNKLPSIFHFASDDDKGGYEFAHKTVGEYFTAVKLYEDYFSFKSNTSYDDFWHYSFEAFKQKTISQDIFDYFFELIEHDNDTINYLNENLRNIFWSGIQNEQFYYEVIKKNPYSRQNPEKTHTFDEQMKIAFRNYSWLLTILQNNAFYDDSAAFIYYKPFLSAYGINCTGWSFCTQKNKISNWLEENIAEIRSYGYENTESDNILLVPLWNKVNLCNSIFKNAIFKNANLRECFFGNSNLENVNFENALLDGSHFEGSHSIKVNCKNAYLRNSIFKNANLSEAIFRNAHLEGAVFENVNLEGIDIENAYYDDNTVFPKEYEYLKGKMKKVENWEMLNGINDIVQEICRVYSHVLHTDVTKGDNFFEFGGDSIKVLSVIVEIEKIYNIRIGVQKIFIYKTPLELARHIKDILSQNIIYK